MKSCRMGIDRLKHFYVTFMIPIKLWQNDAYPNSFNYKSSSTILRLGLCFPAAKAEALGPGVR